MLDPENCGIALELGSYIMGEFIWNRDPDQRPVVATALGDEVLDGDTVAPGAHLSVTFSVVGNMHVLETSSPGSFSGGNLGCSSRRTNSNSVSLTVPADTPDGRSIVLRAAFAAQHGAVTLADEVTLTVEATLPPVPQLGGASEFEPQAEPEGLFGLGQARGQEVTMSLLVSPWVARQHSPASVKYATYRLYVRLGPLARNVYAIHGTDPSTAMGPIYNYVSGTQGPIVLPPAFQVPGPFGEDIARVLYGARPEAEFDSWLTLGMAEAHTACDLRTVGLNFSGWSETNGIQVLDGATFAVNRSCTDRAQQYMGNRTRISNRQYRPWSLGQSDVLVGQLTIPARASAKVKLGFQGSTYDTAPNLSAWRVDGVEFDLAPASPTARSCNVRALLDAILGEKNDTFIQNFEMHCRDMFAQRRVTVKGSCGSILGCNVLGLLYRPEVHVESCRAVWMQLCEITE